LRFFSHEWLYVGPGGEFSKWNKTRRAGASRQDALKDIDELELVIEDAPRRDGVRVAVVASIIVHVLVLYLVKAYKPVSQDAPAPQIARYVELIRQNPRQFTEAPGPKVDSAPLTAPFSDANRAASTPRPTGDRPTTRPGEGGTYVPRSAGGGPGAAAQPEMSAPPQQAQQQAQPQAAQQEQQQPARETNDTFVYRPTQANAAAGTIDWRGAIREVGRVATLGGGQQSLDFGEAGGEKGFAREGPLSFETQWYDWGEYAQSMIARIRYHWYNNMPSLLQMGLKGVVSIRFTIHRDGRISDITILSSSGHRSYDFAAQKAIELSSPLKPLPKDFRMDTERVTAGFFYNTEPPKR
jgi:TonB family protein